MMNYPYDAAGIKLSKVVNDNGALTTTDYAGGFIYENNVLQHFAHEEGRVRLESGVAKYDYFIKDHLGNTRMTLTEARDSVVYDATMETTLAGFEESVFLNIPATRSTEEAFEGSASAKLGPESIGPAKMLMVSPGDTVDLSVYAKYPSGFVSTSSGNSANIGAALASLFGVNGGAATVYEQGVYDNLNSNAGTFLASAINTGSSSVPKAYLNYVFFDQDFNLVMSESGYVAVDAGAEGVFDILEANGLIMEQAGYLYVYLSNEGHTTDGGNVYFDVLRINHKKGHILQEDHYYPFGGSIAALSSSAPLSKPNKYKYNGKEEQTDFDLNWYDYHARMYDPQLMRFTTIDPSADNYLEWTPYNYVGNNPINIIDPDGRDWFEINGKIKWRSWEGDHTTKKGKTYKSLGKNVLVVTHKRKKDGSEDINSATFNLYLEDDKTGPSATIKGNTVPADTDDFGTLLEGLYSAATKTRSNGQEGILINGGGDLPTVSGNPNNSKNDGKDESEHVMDGIWFHAGNSARESLTTLSGGNISEGCLTGRCGSGSKSDYDQFMEAAKGFKGNLYLRGQPKSTYKPSRATTKTHRWVRSRMFFGTLKLVPIEKKTTTQKSSTTG